MASPPSSLEALLDENAANTRRLMGNASIDVFQHSGALEVRRAALLRSSYPLSAPPPVKVVKKQDAVTGVVSLVAQPSPTENVDRKRTREKEENAILDIDAKELKAMHTLVVSEESRKQKEELQYTPPAKWKISKVLVGHQGKVNHVAVDPSNTWFASASFDQLIKVWDLSTGELKLNLTGHKESVNALAISATSPYMFSGSDDHSIKCWDLETNTIVRDFFGHRKAIQALSIHPTLNVVVSAGSDKYVRVWDIRTRQCVHVLEGHRSGVLSVVTHDKEPQVISGGADALIYFWDLTAGKASRMLTQHKKPVRGLTFNGERNRLISCGADDIRVWDIPSGAYLCSASAVAGQSGSTTAADTEEIGYRWSCCAMSPRNVLAVGSHDAYLGLYDWNQPQPPPVRVSNGTLQQTEYYAPYQLVKTKSIAGTLSGEGGINGLTYDFSGTRLITAENDKCVKIWQRRE